MNIKSMQQHVDIRCVKGDKTAHPCTQEDRDVTCVLDTDVQDPDVYGTNIASALHHVIWESPKFPDSAAGSIYSQTEGKCLVSEVWKLRADPRE